MSEVSSKIDVIIQKRKNGLEAVKKELKLVQELNVCVEEFEAIQRWTRQGESDEKYTALVQGNPGLVGKIQALSVASFREAYETYRNQLQLLEERFSRDYLYISFVGRAGQGKSLALQNISGLRGNVIPSCDGMDCTGARSIITNNNENTHARITFYTESEMVEIVNKYLDAIVSDDKYKIFQIKQIPQLPIKEIESRLNYKKSREIAYCKHLRKYIEHFKEYVFMLGTVQDVATEEIERYVAQYCSTDTSQKYYLYLAVKEANILCSFPHQDAGKIVLVDTIGVGATSLGVDDSMLETVERNSDAIAFMFRPDALRPRVSEDEIDIVQKISNRVSHEYAKELLFWVLNRVETGKGKNIDYISEIETEIRNGKYPIAAVLNVDCSSREDVGENLLLPIVNRMVERVEIADKLLLNKSNETKEKLKEEFSKIRHGLENAFVGSASEDMKRQLYPKIHSTYTKVLTQIRDLYLYEYNALRKIPCEEMQKAATEIIQRMNRFIPSQETIKGLLEENNDQHQALRICTDDMRLQIINAFLELNGTLSELVKKMKSKVIQILVQEDGGNLGRILEYSDCSPNQWILDFLKAINGEEKYPYISEALREFAEFIVSVQGFLIFEVRECLDSIDYTLMKQPPQLYHGLESRDSIAAEIIECLKDAVYEISENIQKRINSLYQAPNRAMFAAIKDLYDRLSFSGVGNNAKSVDAEIEWRYLYEDWMHVIFQEDYEKLNSMQAIAKEWNELILKFKKVEQMYTE